MSIVINTTQIKVREYLDELCSYAGYDSERADALWLEILADSELYSEFIYYLEKHTFLDKMSVEGYSLSDVYVWQMDKYNLLSEIGKNPVSCNKETMVLNAFATMAKMKQDPQTFIKRMESGRGNDLF